MLSHCDSTDLNMEELTWSWSNGSWIDNYQRDQYLSPLTLWVRIPLRSCVLDTTLCDKACQWLATGRWISPDPMVSSTNKADRYDITEILLKVALNIKTMQLSLKLRFSFLRHMCVLFGCLVLASLPSRSRKKETRHAHWVCYLRSDWRRLQLSTLFNNSLTQLRV